MIPTNYVLGFLFSESMHRVLLVQKARPSWQAGKLNGIGGHIEPRESAYAAMEREADEEAGITPGSLNWHSLGEMTFRMMGARVFLFSAHDPGTEECLIAPTPEQKTEPIAFYDWKEAENFALMMPNLRWLIPLAFCNEIKTIEIERIEFA